MKVSELMTTSPIACTLTNSLAEAAALMWQNDCGIVPILAEGGKVIGVITDRDICMAAALKGRHLANIAVEDVTSRKVFACRPDDDVRSALQIMKENKVRRLPVLNADGALEGMLSMNDVVLRAEEPKGKKAPQISYADVVGAYKGICEQREVVQPRVAVAGAAAV
jgi:CBS domain-containing protein